MLSCQVPFTKKVKEANLDLERRSIDTLQINLGKRCNLACLHCHVEAGPKRTEDMTEETAARIIELLENSKSIKTLDITGGAPEINAHFKDFVRAAYKKGIESIDRCNLTIFYEDGFEDLPDFLAEHKVRVVASLPCYSKDNVDAQRGGGVFDRSITGLQWLNKLGYGKAGTGLILDLVYNPLGASLPPEQTKLEADYKKELKELFDIEFQNLFAITNMPIKRFQHYLDREGKTAEYMQLLLDNFNPGAAENVMCKDMISVGWTGELFDCDFNQMLEIPLGKKKRNIWDINSFDTLASEPIALANHCYGCTAGAGSSCTGTVA